MAISRVDRLTLFGLKAGTVVASAAVFLVVGFLFWTALPAWFDIGPARFFGDAAWFPSEGQWGLMPMVWGSLLSTLGAVAIAAPLAVCSALFCHYFAPPPVAGAFRQLIALLAGIPSVVYGFWGLVVLVPIIAEFRPPGPSLLAAMVVLALMILPTVTLVVDSGLSQVPHDQIAGAHALGLSKSAVAWRVALPSAGPSVLTGVVLGGARAIGETMAVLMVCGGVVNTPSSVFEPIRTLTANIALEMAYALGDHRAALFFSGLVLVAVVAVLVGFAARLDRGHAHA
jgi:phosphate transport system permease protein